MNTHRVDLKKALRSVPEEALLAFIPFVPVDNVVALKSLETGSSLSSATLPTLSESTSSINHHISMLTSLLKANFLIFLKNVVDNKTFHVFIQSYVAYRHKPYFEVDEENQASVQLFRLDKLVFTVFFRVTCPGDEHHKIPEFVPKSTLTVYNSSASSGSTSANEVDNLDKQFRAVFEQIKILKIPYLMDVISIIGESNQHLSHKLLGGVLRWSPAFSLEFVRNLEETHRATQELVQNLWQAWGRLVASSERSSVAPKKGARVINKSAFTNKVSPSDYLQEIHFLVAFGADIVYSLCQTVASLEKAYLIEGSSLYNGLCLSKDSGMVMLRIIKMVYEIAVPTAIKVIRKGRHLANESTDLLLVVDKIQEFLEVCQYWCVKGLMVFIDVAEYYQNHPHHKSCDGKQVDNKASSQTWIEVLSHRLHVDRILIGATYDPTDLQIGALASDYLRIADRSKLVSLLKSTLSKDDIGNIEYFLSSLCLEDSSLRSSKNGSSTAGNTGNVSATEVVLSSISSTDKKKEAVGADSNKPNDAVMQENIAMIQSIFPDLGEGFIEACLGFYKNKTEEVIEALLSDNLHPQLSAIDRSLKKMWVGKQSLVRDNTSLLYTSQTNTTKAHEDKINYKAFMNSSQIENKRFQEVQKAMVKNIEKSQEYDAYIVDKEYDDDYDDQYDDSWACKKQSVFVPGDNEEESTFKEFKSPLAQAVDWRQQMAETRRYNTLLREEEKEIQFWKDMENTNRKGGNRDQWKKDLEELDAEDDGPDTDRSTHAAKQSSDGQQNAKPKVGSNNQSQNKGKKEPQATNNSNNHSNARDDKESEKSKQAQRRQYERKDRNNDKYRSDRRQRKERQGGFIPGSGL